MIAISDRREPSIIADNVPINNVPINVPKLILEHLKIARKEISIKEK